MENGTVCGYGRLIARAIFSIRRAKQFSLFFRKLTCVILACGMVLIGPAQYLSAQEGGSNPGTGGCNLNSPAGWDPSWNEVIRAALMNNENLLSTPPPDFANLCPGFGSASESDKICAWEAYFQAIASVEDRKMDLSHNACFREWQMSPGPGSENTARNNATILQGLCANDIPPGCQRDYPSGMTDNDAQALLKLLSANSVLPKDATPAQKQFRMKYQAYYRALGSCGANLNGTMTGDILSEGLLQMSPNNCSGDMFSPGPNLQCGVQQMNRLIDNPQSEWSTLNPKNATHYQVVANFNKYASNLTFCQASPPVQQTETTPSVAPLFPPPEAAAPANTPPPSPPPTANSGDNTVWWVLGGVGVVGVIVAIAYAGGAFNGSSSSGSSSGGSTSQGVCYVGAPVNACGACTFSGQFADCGNTVNYPTCLCCDNAQEASCSATGSGKRPRHELNAKLILEEIANRYVSDHEVVSLFNKRTTYRHNVGSDHFARGRAVGGRAFVSSAAGPFFTSVGAPPLSNGLSPIGGPASGASPFGHPGGTVDNSSISEPHWSFQLDSDWSIGITPNVAWTGAMPTADPTFLAERNIGSYCSVYGEDSGGYLTAMQTIGGGAECAVGDSQHVNFDASTRVSGTYAAHRVSVGYTIDLDNLSP